MECGGRRCRPLTFCHEATNACKDCADICHAERRGHYEPALCLEQCRDYLLKLENGETRSVDGTARLLGSLGLAVSLVTILGALLLVLLVYRRPGPLLRLLQRRASRASRDAELAVDTPEMKMKMSNNNKSDIGRDLNNSSVCTVSGSVSEPELRMAGPQQPPLPALPQPLAAPPPPPARHPSEDSTLDYAAYDNPALSPSSSPLPGSGGGSAGGHAKAMEVVLEAVMDHSSLPGSVPRGALYNSLANGHRVESSF